MGFVVVIRQAQLDLTSGQLVHDLGDVIIVKMSRPGQTLHTACGFLTSQSSTGTTVNQIFGVMWLQSTRTSKMILADKDLTSALAPAYPTPGIVAHIGLESSSTV